MKLSTPWRRLLLVTAATLIIALIVAILLPAPASLAVDAKKGLPFYTLPFGDNPFLPGELKTTDHALVDWRGIPSARECGECHRQEFMEWVTSIHAVSDSERIYDTSVRENTLTAKAAQTHGQEKGRWCESCHNPLGMLSGQVTPAASVPDTETMEEGTSCIVCHTARHAEPLAGNGALTINLNKVARHLHPALIMAAPTRHARDMEAKRDNPLMGSSALCGACHTEIRPTSVNGQEPMNFQETYDEWRKSPWAEAGVQCQTCHMARDPAATVAALKRGEKAPKGVSHRIAGNNYLLADPDLPAGLPAFLRGGQPTGLHKMFGPEEYKDEQRRTRDQVLALLKEAAELAVSSKVDQNGQLQLSVTVANRGAGHRLPTGPLDQRHMWLETRVIDDAGKTLFHSGAFDAKTGREDPQAARWVKIVLDEEGKPDLRHMLFDTDRLSYPRKPIAPGGSDRVDYTLAMPEKGNGSYKVEVRLWYRIAFQEILENFERQKLGKVTAVIPPVLMAETSAEISHPPRLASTSGNQKSTP
jgi:hypothetical protein